MANDAKDPGDSAPDRWGLASAFGLPALLGAVLWLGSPYVTGEKEPWDAEGGYYFFGLLIVGFISGVIRPLSPLVTAAGLVVGQFLALLASGGVGPLIILGPVFLAGYGVLGLVGAWFGCRLRAPPNDKPFGI